MGNLNYVIPQDEMSVSDRQRYRKEAAIRLVQRALGQSRATQQDLELVSAGRAPKSVDIRDFQNILDAGTAVDHWRTAALAAVGTAYSCFQAIGAPTLANNKFAIFYKISVETIPMPVSRVIFRSGGAVGNILGVFDTEPLATQQALAGYMTEPVVVDPTITWAIQVLCRIATGAFARVQIGSLVLEPAGQTIA